MTNLSPVWSDERVTLLKELWARGLSASQIGDELGVTRSAVLSKRKRLGLPAREQDEKFAHGKGGNFRKNNIDRTQDNVGWRIAQKKKRKLVKAAPAPVISDLSIPLEQRRSLLELNENNCRWPVGDPQSPEFFFCAAVPVPGHPYCVGHMARAYQPPRQRGEMSKAHLKFLNGEYRGKAA